MFDADKVKGTIHARLAREGESIEALDGKTYALDSGMTVIADDSGPIGIAGIIGGAATGVRARKPRTCSSKSAYFDPIRTAATGRKLGIHSDARYRFERGVDPAFARPGAEIATRMILELCGGEASELVQAGAPPIRSLAVPLRMDRVKTLAGVDIPSDEQLAILAGARLHHRRHGRRRPRSRFRPGGPTSTAKRIWWKRSSASTGSTRWRMCRCRGWRR